MKRTLFLALAICIVFTLIGCQEKSFKDKMAESGFFWPNEVNAYEGTLRVYAYIAPEYPQELDPATWFADAQEGVELDLVLFNDAAEFHAQISEDVKNNTLPDVLFFDNASGVDVRALAELNLLLDLSAYTEKDITYTYEKQEDDRIVGPDYIVTAYQLYEPVMQAGWIDHKQLFLPLAFTLPVYIGAQERLDVLQTALAECATTQEQYTTVAEFIRTHGYSDGQYGYLSYPTEIDVTQWLCGAGVDLYDAVTDDTTALEDIRPLLDLLQTMQAQIDMAEEEGYYKKVLPSKQGDNVKTICKDAVLFHSSTYFCEQYMQEAAASLMLNDETLQVFGFPLPDSGEGYGAMVTACGAVTTSCQNPELAYAFLRHMFLTGSPFGTQVGIGSELITDQLASDKLLYREDIMGISESIEKTVLFPPRALQDAVAEAFALYDGSDESFTAFLETVRRATEKYYNFDAETRVGL